MYRAGIIGLGLQGRRHARELLGRGVEVYAVDREGDCPSFVHPVRCRRELFDKVDMVVVATPDDTHGEMVCEALREGKHVFCEKPLCMRWDELSSIKSAYALGGDVVLAVHFPLRQLSDLKDLRDGIFWGEFGEIYLWRGEYRWARPHKFFSTWRRDYPPGFLILGGGIHLIDLFVWSTGGRLKKDVISVFASRAGTGGRFCSYISASFQCEGTDLVVSFSVDAYAPSHGHVVEVCGTEKRFCFDSTNRELAGYVLESSLEDFLNRVASFNKEEEVSRFREYVQGTEIALGIADKLC